MIYTFLYIFTFIVKIIIYQQSSKLVGFALIFTCFGFLIRVEIIILITMRSKRQKQDKINQISTPSKPKIEEQQNGPFASQIKELEGALLLTQLTGSYFKLLNQIRKATYSLQHKYYSSKMHAFLLIRDAGRNHYYSKAFTSVNQHCIKLSKDEELWKTCLQQKVNKRLKSMCSIISRKLSSRTCFSLLQIMRQGNENSQLKILSDRSSRIETLDSSKSQTKRYQIEKPSNRKSYSTEKTPNNKYQNFIPVKMQVQRGPLSSMSNSPLPQILSQLSEVSRTGDRKQVQKKGKSTSDKKYSHSQLITQKDEKIQELDALRRKHQKLMAQFNSFSQRFLQVIQEEDP